ncbi:MAG: putative Ig domain-containing protein [Myxococcota bacterium]
MRAPCTLALLVLSACAEPSTLRDEERDTGEQPIDASVAPPGLVIETEPLPSAQVGEAYRSRLQASGGAEGARTWSLAGGDLPLGLELSDEGVLEGRPRRPETARFEVQVEDLEGEVARAGFELEVESEPLRIVQSSVRDGATTRRYEAAVRAEGGFGPLSWRVVDGALPPGVGLVPRTSTAALEGYPQEPGRYPLTLEVRDRADGEVERTFDINIVDDAVGGEPAMNRTRRVERTHLRMNARTGEATAALVVGPSPEPGLTVDLDGPTLLAVDSPVGPLAFATRDGQLDIGLPRSTQTTTVTINYRMKLDDLRGARDFFPDTCGEAFPCRPHPRDAAPFAVSIEEAGPGRTAVFPERLQWPALAFQVGWVVAELEYIPLGRTPNGLELGIYAPTERRAEAMAGTSSLVAIATWLEERFGAYAWGPRYAPVVAGSRFYALETHPSPQIPAGAGDEVSL